MNNYKIYKAEPKDLDTIYTYIHKLAAYEKRPQDAFLTKEDLNTWLFTKHIAEVQLLSIEDKPAGYALYYPVFASFAAQAHIHLEDMYIDEEYRKQGAGHLFLQYLSSYFLAKGYTGMEWSALDWNTNAHTFYLHIGADQDHGRVYFSLDQKHMTVLSDKNKQIERISSMEETMNRLQQSLNTNTINNQTIEDYHTLDNYYSTLWQEDYTADENHTIPSFLKRGILSEDALYDLLYEAEEKMHIKQI